MALYLRHLNRIYVFKIIWTLVILIGFNTAAGKTKIPLVGVFTDDDLETSVTVFEKLAERSVLYHGKVLHPITRDSYSVSMEVCQHSENERGIAAVIDARPTNGICDNVCMISNKRHVPHLSIGWQPIDEKAEYIFTLSYYPDPEILSKAYSTLIRDVLKWDEFAILYENDDSFTRLQDVIHSWPYGREPIMFKKLNPDEDNKETFKYVFKVAKVTYFIFDCAVENIPTYMKQVVEVENSTQYLSFLFTSLEAKNLNFREIPINLKSNFSVLSIMNDQEKNRWGDYGMDSSYGEKMETALTADALTHLEKVLMKMDDDKEIPPISVICRDTNSPYEEENTENKFLTALLNTTSSGFTGNVEFDSEGKRTNLKMYYFKRTYIERNLTFGGYWESFKDSFTLYEPAPEPERNFVGEEIIKVGSKKGLPYFEMRKNENGTYEPRGFAVDLINEVFKYINKEKGWQWKPEFVDYGIIGNRIEGTKRWTGLMGALIDHEIEMAICDLSITSDRLSVVDFSTPFMSTGISMLFKEPDPVMPDRFSFLNPLSLDVWFHLGTTYIIVSFIMFICARMSEDDWVNPHPCNQNPDHLENIWSFYNCTWLTMGAIMTQGCDILPRGFGSRWIAGMWWFFSLIVTASYTANMSTFLSNSRRSNDIKDVKMLSEQTEVSYGAVTNSATYNFFKDSNDTTIQKLWAVMKSTKPEVFTKSNDEGKERVLKSKSNNYVFFMEATAIRYYAERECKLKIVGHQLDSKSYGIAMPKNFRYKSLVDLAILELQEKGKLTSLETLWWETNDNEEHCKEKKEKEEKEGGNDGSLQMENTSGIFIVLGAGTILGLIVAIIDFMMHAHQVCVKERVTFKEALASEWRASLNPRTLHKPAAPPRSAQPSPSPSPLGERSQSRAVSVLRAATSFINFDEIY